MTKTVITSIRLTETERRVLTENGARYGLTMTAYLKRVAGSQRLLEPLFDLKTGAEIRTRLNTIGRDLNEVAHVMHASRFKVDGVSEKDLEALTKQVESTLAEVRSMSSTISSRQGRLRLDDVNQSDPKDVMSDASHQENN